MKVREMFQSVRAWDFGRMVVLLQSAALISSLIVPSWALHTYHFSKSLPGPISVALSFLAVIIAMVVAQLYVSCVLKYRTTVRERRANRAKTQITHLLAEYLSGETRTAALSLAYRERRDDFAACATQALLVVKGDSRARMRGLIREIGLYSYWIEGLAKRDEAQRKRSVDLLGLLESQDCQPIFERALAQDPSPFVQAAAIRALLRFSGATCRQNLLDAIEERPFLVRLFAAAETGGYPAIETAQQPPPAAVSEQLLLFDRALRENDRQTAFQMLDQLIAEGDARLAAISAEALGAWIAAPLRGEAVAA